MAVQGQSMDWCGQGAVAYGWLSPCLTKSVLSALALLLGSLILFQCWVKCRAAPQSQRCRIWQADLGAAQVLSCLCYLGLSLAHLGRLVFFFFERENTPYIVFSNVCLATLWCLSLVTIWRGWRTGVSLQLRLLSWQAVPLYTWALFLSVHAVVVHAPGVKHPGFSLFVNILEVSAVVTAAISETCKSSNLARQSGLKEALLHSQDVENGRPVDADNRKRSWYGLVIISLLYVWPEGTWMQLRAVACIFLLLILRVLNIAVPVVYKHLVDVFSSVSMRTHPPPGITPETVSFMAVFYPWVLAYMVVAFLQGGSGGGTVGLISNLRSYLWIPITQQAYRRICLDVFSHALDLDLNFHLHRKTGEMTRVMDRGTSSIQNTLTIILFNIAPQILDIAAASFYLATAIQPWIAVIVFVTLFSYIPITIYLTEWRGQFRRDMNRLENAKGAKVTDALLNYETVKYFNNEAHEVRGFASAIDDYQTTEFQLNASLNILNAAQSIVIFSGLLSGLGVCTQGVAKGTLTVGDAVLFVTLMQQLYAPLNFFGTFYRTIQQSMIDMENMFDLLAINSQIKDGPNAVEAVAAGDVAPTVEFENVTFGYNENNPVLKQVSFSIGPGKTLALVGATGSGKSTVLRLLFRFYEPQSGAIRINGQPLSDITLASLRRLIGVVPQDTVLFNDTIMYNIRYGRMSASEDDVYRSSDAASIHETISTRFPQGYDTVVGERGLRLSGGEKQRVAFARAILKDAQILLLDEATSALDSLTEHNVQAALDVLKQHRTTIIVAHRLSTIMAADTIVVLKDGQVMEVGSHPELLQLGGIYAEMWARQQESSMDRTESSMSIKSATSDVDLSERVAAYRPPHH